MPYLCWPDRIMTTNGFSTTKNSTNLFDPALAGLRDLLMYLL